MAWTEPQYSSNQVDAAGKTLVNPAATDDELERAYTIVNNWRSSHSFPLNTFQTTLRKKGRAIDDGCLVAQRIKRLSSIEHKLSRFKTMQLSQMQDLGGSRAILQSIGKVHDLVNAYKKSEIKHKLDHIDDYLMKPRASGYRGVHFIYRYFSDRQETYNGLKIEMQLRSTLQHAWATAVETVGTFTRQALKSSQGEADWLRFFALMSSAIALREGTPTVPGTPDDKKALVAELSKFANKLDVVHRLKAYSTALNAFEDPSVRGAHYFLLKLDAQAKQVTVQGFKAGELELASKQYLELERSILSSKSGDAVLVSVDSLASLRKAYPNYFLDTDVFITALGRALK